MSISSSLSIVKQNRRCHGIDIRFSEFRSASRRGTEGMDEGKQSWYAEPETAAALISVTRRVRCTLRVADRIIDRWMVGVGKGKRARPASVPLHPVVLFLSFSFLASLHHSSRYPLPILSLSFSRWSPCFLPLSCFRYLLSVLLGFRYLIKSSYDEKDEDPAGEQENSVVTPSFLFGAIEAAMLVREKLGNDNERQVKVAIGGSALFESAN